MRKIKIQKPKKLLSHQKSKIFEITKEILSMPVLILALTLFITLSINFVFAFGVTSSYWEGSPLRIAPGETKTVYFGLQNMAGGGDITVRAEITNGKEIASTEDKEYLVKAGTKDTKIPVKIEIPTDALGSKEYIVTLSVVTITPSGGGAVTLGTASDTTFPVVVSIPEKPKEEAKWTSNLIWIITAVIIIIIAIIVTLIIKRRRE